MTSSISTFLGRSMVSPRGTSHSSGSYSSQLVSSETSTVNNVAPKEVSPIFLQFLDSLAQIIRQFPESFEYSEKLLVFLLTHVYSCQFGTFLFNNQKEKTEFLYRKDTDSLPVDACTVSIWDHISANPNDFLNGSYANLTNAMPSIVTGELFSQCNDEEILYPDSSRLHYWTAELIFNGTSFRATDSADILNTPSHDRQYLVVHMEEMNIES